MRGKGKFLFGLTLLVALLAMALTASAQTKYTLGPNLLQNSDFSEIGSFGNPVGWWTHTWNGSGSHQVLPNAGRDGGAVIAITSSSGIDAHWEQQVALEVGAQYLLSGWIKTENVSGALGAMISIHEMQDQTGALGGRTVALQGTNDWTYVETIFTAQHDYVTVLGLMGGWGLSSGTVMWDDIQLRKIIPDYDLTVLFWGGTQGHQPQDRLRNLVTPMLDRGIKIHYVHGDVSWLDVDILSRYDVVLIYGNMDTIDPVYANAVIEYVENGGGLVAVHAASFMWRNTDFIPLVGAQFQSHPPIASMTTRVVEPNHPIMIGYEPFTAADEPYIHTRHNPENRIVLEVSAYPGNEGEPYTWIRTQGQGRVFYTAWGHDQRTWTNPGFHDLLERGIRWAAGQDVQKALAEREISNPFTMMPTPAPIPTYSYGGPSWNEVQAPLSGEESLSRIIVPGGFELHLYAADPMVFKPIDINWDADGRTWVLESVDYPYHNTPVNEWPSGRDRIVILTDTDGDGVADHRHVWVDNLNIPTSFVFWGDGVIIAQQPYFIYYADLDGDDVADYREVILTGFPNRGDTHAGPSSLTYGLDNLIYGACGYSCGGGVFNQSVYRFDPSQATGQNRSQVFEHVANTNNNTWGFGQSEEGLLFTSTANGNPSGYIAIPARYYTKTPGMSVPMTPPAAGNPLMLHVTNYVRQVDHGGRYTAGSGHHLYTARSFPSEFWNRVAFTNEPTGGVVGIFVLQHDQATVTTSYTSTILASDDQWVSPIISKVGPDGALWVLDWYNIINQHNPTPSGFTAVNAAYVTPNRENEYGRIYRIVWSEGEPSQQLKLSNASVTDLVNALKNDNMFWRLTAQRIIVHEQLWGAIPALIELVNDQSVDEIGLNPAAIHALWTLHGLGALTDENPVALEAAVNALQHPSAGVRRNAILVLPHTWASRDAIVTSGALYDENAQVVLAALLALSDMPASKATGAAIFNAVIDNPQYLDDIWLRDAIRIAATAHAEGFVAAAEAAGVLGGEGVEIKYGPNLVVNPGFEELAPNGNPVGWSTRTYAQTGGVTFSVDIGGGRNGGNAIKIQSGSADASWGQVVQMEVGATYHLSGWIKTENLTGAKGAVFSMDAMQDVDGTRGSRTRDFHGTNDWTYVESTFVADRTQDTLLALFGGWGRSNGTAWWDDVSLRKIETDASGVLAILANQVAETLK